MKSEWKVSRNYINGDNFYQVYRLLDVAEVDHSGNREYTEIVFDNSSAWAAQALASRLNGRKEN